MHKAVPTAVFALAAILFVASANMAPTTATFSDKVTSTGSTFTAGTLATPGVALALDATNPAKVDVTSSDTDPIPVTLTVYRHLVGGCTDTGTNIATGPGTSTDYPGPPPGPYYYQVVATYQQWSSKSNCASIRTSNPSNTLFTNTGNQLLTTYDSATETIGCATLQLFPLLCLSLAPADITFGSVGSYSIYPGSWTVSLQLSVKALLAINLGSQRVVADLWYVPAAQSCATGTQTAIGSGSAPLGTGALAIGASLNQLVTVVVNGSASPSSSSSKVCLKVSGNPAFVSLSLVATGQFVINNGLTSFVQGPFAP